MRKAFLAVLLAASVTPALAQEKTFELKISHWVPSSHPPQKSLEDWAAAVVELKALLAWEPGDADAHYRVGHALLRLRKFDEAVAELRSAVASKNGMAEAHYDLAVALKAGGELEEAAREFRVAQKLNPSLTIPR